MGFNSSNEEIGIWLDPSMKPEGLTRRGSVKRKARAEPKSSQSLGTKRREASVRSHY